MTKQQWNNRNNLLNRIAKEAGWPIDFATVDALLKGERALHRWAEEECGMSNRYGTSWCIVRDETTGKPFREVQPSHFGGKVHREPARDMERGALKRIAATCKAFGLHYYHQSDPRGCALYVAGEPLTDQNYSSNGIAVTI